MITAPTSTTNITGLRTWTRGSSLRSDVDDRAQHDRAVEQGPGTAARFIGRGSFLVESEVELEHVDAGLAEEAEEAAVGVVGDELVDAVERQVAHGGDAVRLDARVGLGDVGSTPEAEVVTASTGTSAAVRPGS